MKKIFILFIFIFYSSLLFAKKNPAHPPVYKQTKPYLLIDQNERFFNLKTLKGEPWLVQFIFSRCLGPCPLLLQRFKKLDASLPSNVKLISITVDPEYDSPNVLTSLIQERDFASPRWFFLTGKKDTVYQCIRENFLVGITENPSTENPNDTFIHSTKIVLVDATGKIRGYYDGLNPDDAKKILRDVNRLQLERQKPWVFKLPRINAGLNFVSAVLLLTGFCFIKLKKIQAHRLCMETAFIVSTCFLISYLLYHHYVGSIPFPGKGPIKMLYLAILISHSFLAACVPALAIITFYHALKENFVAHKKIARWTFPIWLYVSMTGITIYWMLY